MKLKAHKDDSVICKDTHEVEPPSVFLIEEEKMRLCLNRVKAKTSERVKPVFLVWAIIDKPTVINEPAVPSARLLGLGSKLYPSSMQRMPNKDIT